MWLKRISALVRRSTDHVFVVAPVEYGGDSVVGSVVRKGVPVIRLAYRAESTGTDVFYGNQLSDALEEAIGYRLYGYGVPIKYGIAVLRSQLHLLGRLTVTITGADHAPEEVLRDLLACDARQVQVVASFGAVRRELHDLDVMTIDSADLTLTLAEAESVAKHMVSRNEIAGSWHAASGAYLSFIAHINRMTTLPPLPMLTNARTVPPDAARQLLAMFVRQGRWLEALEVAVEHDATEAIEIFRRGAPLMMDQGLFERLWILLSKLDATELESDDELFYWYFSVATAVNEHRSLAYRVREYLEKHEAPDLRARWAVAMPSSSSLAEAERAFATRKNVNTARALGFVLTMSGHADRAVAVLKEALEIAESTEDSRQVCATALDISHSLAFLAHYSSAKSWAHWGLARFNQLRVGDELLRLALTNQVAYLSLLTDELGAAEEAIEGVALPEELIGTPMSEGLLSTMGDLSLVRGDAHGAVEIYRKSYEHYPRASIGLGALDLVKAMLSTNNLDEARAVLRQAMDVSMDDEASNGLALKLAAAHLAFKSGDFDEAINHYGTVASGSESASNAFFATQGILGLALSHLKNGDTRQARKVLHAQRSLWQDLGESGWCLMTIDPPTAVQLRSLAQGSRAKTQLLCLGDRRLVTTNESRTLSLRFAELAVVLALRPEGHSSESLLLELYGEDGRLGSLKALLSRAREYLPIVARPYRLEELFRCDFIDLDDVLEAGRLREALELYKGPLLPESEAPGIRRARERIDEAVRQAVLHSGEWDLALRLARKFPDDLELWEEAGRLAPKNDPAYPLIRAQVRRIRGEWGL